MRPANVPALAAAIAAIASASPAKGEHLAIFCDLLAISARATSLHEIGGGTFYAMPDGSYLHASRDAVVALVPEGEERLRAGEATEVLYATLQEMRASGATLAVGLVHARTPRPFHRPGEEPRRHPAAAAGEQLTQRPNVPTGAVYRRPAQDPDAPAPGMHQD